MQPENVRLRYSQQMPLEASSIYTDTTDIHRPNEASEGSQSRSTEGNRRIPKTKGRRVQEIRERSMLHDLLFKQLWTTNMDCTSADSLTSLLSSKQAVTKRQRRRLAKRQRPNYQKSRTLARNNQIRSLSSCYGRSRKSI